MAGQELVRSVSVAVLPPAQGPDVFVLGFQHRKTTNFLEIAYCSAGRRHRVSHRSAPFSASHRFGGLGGVATRMALAVPGPLRVALTSRFGPARSIMRGERE